MTEYVIKSRCGSSARSIASNLICLIIIIQTVNFVNGHSLITKRAALDLREGEQCPGGGVCKKDRECPVLINLLKTNKQAVVMCGFQGRTAIVCCPPEGGQYTGGQHAGGQFNPTDPMMNMSGRKCMEYGSTSCPQKRRTPSQGALQPEDLPFLARVGHGDSLSEVNWFCTGTLISNRFVLSAAHCSVVKNDVPVTWVLLGKVYQYEERNTEMQQLHRIVERINYPYFNKLEKHYHNIALYKIENAVTFSPYIKPICLNQIENFDHHLMLTSIEFKRNRGSGVIDKILAVREHISDWSPCGSMAEELQYPNEINKTLICAHIIDGENGTCFTEAGGPLYETVRLNDNDCPRYIQYGIPSFGQMPCGISYKTVYTSVADYLKWIESVVWTNVVSP